jgi:hypothetical protein
MRALLLAALALSLAGCQTVAWDDPEGPGESPCGQYDETIRWRLTAPAVETGWLVQKVTQARDLDGACTGVEKHFEKVYWEAWRIEKGHVTESDSFDRWIIRQPVISRGSFRVTAVARFFAGLSSLPPDFVHRSPLTGANALPSTVKEPAFWSSWGEKTRTTHPRSPLEWDCCEVVAGQAPRTLPPDAPAAARIVDGIEPWTRVPYGPRERAALEDAARRLRALSLEEVRRGVAVLCGRDGDLDARSKVYLALRALFAVPAEVEYGDALAFGGWVLPEGSRFPLAWPLRFEGARIVAVEPFAGYLGAEYDGAAELDWLQARYGVRKE